MRIKSNTFWVESKDKKGKEQIIAHSKDAETGELYHLFLSRTKANKLLKDEKKVSPQYKYRVIREVREIFMTQWE